MDAKTSKLEEVLTQFMQASISTNKNTEVSIKKLEMQVEKLANQLKAKSNNENCKVVITRSGKGREHGGKNTSNKDVKKR